MNLTIIPRRALACSMIFLSVVALSTIAEGAEKKEIPSVVDGRIAGWKGPPRGTQLTVGGVAGLGLYGSQAGPTIAAQIAKKIVEGGFAPGINNQVFIEAQVGYLRTPTLNVFTYAAQLRWDFHFDHHWTLFAIGGLGGNFNGANIAGSWALSPRFGVGSFYRIVPGLMIRAEVVHDQIAVGVNFGL